MIPKAGFKTTEFLGAAAVVGLPAITSFLKGTEGSGLSPRNIVTIVAIYIICRSAVKVAEVLADAIRGYGERQAKDADS